jgi:hypothetical protein
MSLLRPWSRGRPKYDVKPGNRYRRRLDSGLTATATVLDIRPDRSGIAHVLFAVAVEGSAGEGSDSTRLLALRSFADMYREQIA